MPGRILQQGSGYFSWTSPRTFPLDIPHSDIPLSDIPPRIFPLRHSPMTFPLGYSPWTFPLGYIPCTFPWTFLSDIPPRIFPSDILPWTFPLDIPLDIPLGHSPSDIPLGHIPSWIFSLVHVPGLDIYTVDTVLPVHIVYGTKKPPLNLPLEMAEWRKLRLMHLYRSVDVST